MNVTLIDLAMSSPIFRAPSSMPVYLSSIAAVLRKAGHEVDLIERQRFMRNGESSVVERVSRELVGAAPELVLFDVRAETASDFKTFSAVARKATPGALMFAGGRHPTVCPEETLRACPDVDGIIIGEAENSMVELAGGASPHDIPSLALRTNGTIERTAGQPRMVDLDTLPLPAWDLLDMEFYTRRSPRVIPCLPLKTATLETSRGCDGACAFCSEGRMFPGAHRFHGAAYVAGALRHLIEKYGIEGVYFCDESFLANTERVVRLCDELIRQGLHREVKWSAQVRTDCVTREILSVMRKAGCVQLEFGVESGSQRMLDSVAKGVRVERSAEAIRLAREEGIRSLAYIMFGVPGETQDDLRLTMRFLDEARPHVIRATRFIPLPGTPATRKLVAGGALPPDFWTESKGSAAFVWQGRENVSAMTLDELRRESRRLYFRYFLPRYLSDFLRHNRLVDIFTCVEPRAVLPFLKAKMLGR